MAYSEHCTDSAATFHTPALSSSPLRKGMVKTYIVYLSIFGLIHSGMIMFLKLIKIVGQPTHTRMRKCTGLIFLPEVLQANKL